ncbi:hypothetical protein [Mitsuaria sp. 7]|uniref:hypothetical protein n=1 Tax=Mitsuaria sp. 7 TaxID=1658665 RepID=UPI0007DE29C7|nr:hypothetical protein [Mitsuaria sp. 7]ANH69223.1 hypothetical protein ABE85_19590 [Mitsuaria sp. 7]
MEQAEQADQAADDDSVIAALQSMHRQMEAMTEALYALHLQATNLQALLCAAVDTHPQPVQLQRCFEEQIEHTLRQVRPHHLKALNEQTQAWLDRIGRRVRLLESRDLDPHAAHSKVPYMQ